MLYPARRKSVKYICDDGGLTPCTRQKLLTADRLVHFAVSSLKFQISPKQSFVRTHHQLHNKDICASLNLHEARRACIPPDIETRIEVLDVDFVDLFLSNLRNVSPSVHVLVLFQSM